MRRRQRNAAGTGTALDPYTSIQSAIDQSVNGSFNTVSVAAGTYVENITINKNIRVVSSAGPELCIIQAAAPGPVVDVGSVFELRGFTITGGHGPSDANGLHDAGAFSNVIEDCIVYGNAGQGLHIESTEGTGVIRKCTIVNNGLEGLWMGPGTGIRMQDSIIWDNGLDSTFSFANHAGSSFRHCDIEDVPFNNSCASGEICGVFSADPLFEDPGAGNFRLRLGSPCIDAGDPYSPLDPDGSAPDIGALVFDPQASPGPSVYSTNTVNSQGCSPAIAFTGSPSASGSPFEITCSETINNKLGLLFYGFQSKALPYQGTTLCVTAPVKRTSVQDSGGNPPPDDCSGQYVYDFDARIQSGADANLVSGSLVYTQFWFRDPNQGAQNSTGRSDALAFLILP